MTYTLEEFRKIVFEELRRRGKNVGGIWTFNEYGIMGSRMRPPMDNHEFQYHMEELVLENLFTEEANGTYRLTEKCAQILYP